MTETDLSTWLPIADAAARIGCSTRTVERLAAAKKLEARLRRQDGTPPVMVLSPESVAEVAAGRRREAAPFVVASVGNGNGNGHPSGVKKLHAGTDLARVQTFEDARAAMVAVVTDLARELHAAISPPSPPVAETLAESRLFLTIPEAAVLTGLSQAYLRRKCQEGWAGAFKDGSTWKLRRGDLETL